MKLLRPSHSIFMENPWQDFFLKFALEEDWQQSLSNYTQKLGKQVEAFWVGTLENSQQMAQLWLKLLEVSVNFWSESPQGSTLIQLNDLYWNLAYEKTLGSLTNVPLLGISRGFNSQSLQVMDAWAKLYPTAVNYQIILLEIQTQSFRELLQELNSLAAKGEAVRDWEHLQQLWSFTADRVFEQAFCSEDNLRVRGKFLNAINNYKFCQQEFMELWMKMMNLPIRSEVDEIHKNIYELRKEVKSLKKKLAQSTGTDNVHGF